MLLEDVFEPVLEVVECADGRRKGIALLQGKPHAFTSRFSSATGGCNDARSAELFDLSPVGAPIVGARPILAYAHFRAVPAHPMQAVGQVRRLEVCWQVIEQVSA
jgi:hypothetical protein